MLGQTHIYYIYYGDWSVDLKAAGILNTFAHDLIAGGGRVDRIEDRAIGHVDGLNVRGYRQSVRFGAVGEKDRRPEDYQDGRSVAPETHLPFDLPERAALHCF